MKEDKTSHPMLLSTVITLTPSKPATLPSNLGRATHAWFLDRVRVGDLALAEALHASNQERPFTVSNLWGAFRPEKGQISLAPETTCFLRLTSLSAQLSSLLEAGNLLPREGETVELLDNSFRVLRVARDPETHPWASAMTYEALVQRHTLAPYEPSPRLALLFASPTVFRSDGVNVLLPLPGLVFGSLARRWNAFSPIRIPDEVRRFAEECLLVSRYRLRTEFVRFGEAGEHGANPGFVGTCSYTFRVRDRYWMGLIHLLARFALYAGIGARTSMGLGQCRPLDLGAGKAGPRSGEDARAG